MQEPDIVFERAIEDLLGFEGVPMRNVSTEVRH
jgi:hypothetical protein